jgi:pimeloyl-ACP methyl ester carboxylesterase
MPAITTYQVPAPTQDAAPQDVPPQDVPVTLTEQGDGAPVLLLHGGAGPDSVAGLAALLAADYQVRALMPTHPGFSQTPRPALLASARSLAAVYGRLLGKLGLAGVTVIGSSVGGWVAAELALAAPDRVTRLILLDAVGLASAEHPAADFFSLTPAQVAELAWAEPAGRQIDPATLPLQQQQVLAGNRAALLAYGGRPMTDPSLAARLAGIAAATLVVWGEADRIVTPAYGRQYAAAIPGAAFRLIPGSGHLPQLETPQALLPVIADFGGWPSRA